MLLQYLEHPSFDESWKSNISKLLRTGHISSFRVPELLDICLRSSDVDIIETILNCVKDIQPDDLAKCLIFLLPRLDTEQVKCIVADLVSQEFNRDKMISCFKTFGSVQIQLLLDLLIAMMEEGLVDSSNWLSLLLDTHVSLLVLQPLFFPYLKKIHEVLGGYVGEIEQVENIYSLLTGITEPIGSIEGKNFASSANQYGVASALDL